MALPALPLILLGGLAFYAMSGNKGSSASGLSPSASPKYDKNLPAVIEATVDQELLQDTDPTQLTTLAQSLQTQGFPIAAGALLARAAVLTANANAPAPVINPVTPPVAQPAPTPPDATGTVTLPTTEITGTPTVTPWPAGLTVPTVSTAIPSNYTAQSQETTDVQTVLNNWASETSAPLAQLTVDGLYGPATQQMAAAFQAYSNALDPGIAAGTASPMTVDGLAGPDTQAMLGVWAPAGSSVQTSGFSKDGGY